MVLTFPAKEEDVVAVRTFYLNSLQIDFAWCEEAWEKSPKPTKALVEPRIDEVFDFNVVPKWVGDNFNEETPIEFGAASVQQTDVDPYDDDADDEGVEYYGENAEEEILDGDVEESVSEQEGVFPPRPHLEPRSTRREQAKARFFSPTEREQDATIDFCNYRGVV